MREIKETHETGQNSQNSNWLVFLTDLVIPWQKLQKIIVCLSTTSLKKTTTKITTMKLL